MTLYKDCIEELTAYTIVNTPSQAKVCIHTIVCKAVCE